MLVKHCGIQAICFMWVGWKFALINAVIHGVIDWNIWRAYKMYVSASHDLANLGGSDYKYWEDHLFYVTIGLDQFLHMTTLVTVYGVVQYL